MCIPFSRVCSIISRDEFQVKVWGLLLKKEEESFFLSLSGREKCFLFGVYCMLVWVHDTCDKYRPSQAPWAEACDVCVGHASWTLPHLRPKESQAAENPPWEMGGGKVGTTELMLQARWLPCSPLRCTKPKVKDKIMKNFKMTTTEL